MGSQRRGGSALFARRVEVLLETLRFPICSSSRKFTGFLAMPFLRVDSYKCKIPSHRPSGG